MIDSHHHHHLLLLLSPQNQCRDGSRTNSSYPGPITLLKIPTFSKKPAPQPKKKKKKISHQSLNQ